MPPTLVALKPRTVTPRAPAPAVPVRQYSFTDWQVNNPTEPPPGDRLDAEYDRANTAITQTITWAGTSLNTDGSIRDATIGENQLKPGLFADISNDAIADLQPHVDTAVNASGAAASSASAAAASASSASSHNATAQAAATTATTEASAASASAAAALSSENTSAVWADDAENAANSTAGDVAICTDYGVLTQAWAEHMPDTIPPNILAVMDVTGDHWSSRWWANRAHEIVQDETAEAICDLQHYWMGAYSNPPTHNTCGDPVVAGAMYYNLTYQVCQVYDGTDWHNITQLSPGDSNEYLFLPAVPTTVFTGADYHGNVLTLDAVNANIGVYLNGVRLLLGIDYSVTATSVTMLLGPVTAPNSVEIISLQNSSSHPPPTAIKVNTTPWVFDGVTKTFPLADSVGTPITPPGSVDCLVSVNGVIQEAGGDFTVSTNFINFITAPEADADRWMVIGLPIGPGTALVREPGLAPVTGAGATDISVSSGDLFLSRVAPMIARIEALEARVAALEARA